MQFDFDFIRRSSEIKSKRDSEVKSRTIEQVMNQVNQPENDSIEWDQFEVPQNSNYEKSQTSDYFGKQKSESNEDHSRNQHNKSKNISQISYFNHEGNQSFHFETNVEGQNPHQNSRYQRLKKLLNTAKMNSLDIFYKNIDKIHKQPEVKHNFNSKQQFGDYIRDLKDKKKRQEQHFANIPKKESQQQYPYYQNKHENQNPYNFNKKQLNQIHSKQFITEDYPKDDIEYLQPQDHFFDFEPKIKNQKPKIADKIKNQRTKQENIDDQRAKEQKMKQQKIKERREKQQKIESQKANKLKQHKVQYEKQTKLKQQNVGFDKNAEQQKLSLLIKNYQYMRHNFDDLIMDLKQTNNGQERIVNEFQIIKEQLHKRDNQQEKQRRKIQKNHSKELKQQHFQQIKQQITKIKENNKDIMFLKINQKIQSLQSAVKLALEQLTQEQEPPFVPKMINYFCDPQPEQSRSSHSHSRQQFNNQTKNNVQAQKPLKFNTAYIQQQNSRSNIISPFDLANLQPEYSQDEQIKFIPIENAQLYYPKKIEVTNRNIRNSLTQKSSMVYESFEFHISSKYTILDDPNNPIMAQIRVNNKCIINLADVLVIVYGAQGSTPIVKPSNIYLDLFKQNSNFNFQVFLNRQCLNDNGFYIQISYKSDVLTKKKVNVKVPIPILQLIRPQFIYEQQFLQTWNNLENQIYISPKALDFMHIRSHEDIKLILPFTNISQNDPNIFCYGLLFKYIKCQGLLAMKLYCLINGKASVHLRGDKLIDSKIKEELLDVMNLLLFSP